MATFAAHEDAVKAEQGLGALDWGISLAYNDRPYDEAGGRGWCIFESGVSLTITAHLTTAKRSSTMPWRFAFAQRSRPKVIDLQGSKAVEVVEARNPQQLLMATEQSIGIAHFTGKADREDVQVSVFASLTPPLAPPPPGVKSKFHCTNSPTVSLHPLATSAEDTALFPQCAFERYD